MTFSGKRVLVTGGTGSLGQALVRRLLSHETDSPASVTVFSRDEAKQHYMRLSFLRRRTATDEIVYKNFNSMLRFRIGDVRDFGSVVAAVKEADVVIHAAALKQVPTCEYFPTEAVRTNVGGSSNLTRAIREHAPQVDTVVGLSTDKACKPINVMGMTKALMERVLIEANLDANNGTRFVCVRYGNVIASRGSVVPFFREQIAQGGPVTITMREMTRFLLTLDQAVETVMACALDAQPGETYVPRAPAARIVDVAAVMIGNRQIPTTFTGIRPGEKIHEIMISEEERYRTIERGSYYVIQPMLPELQKGLLGDPLPAEYSSEDVTLDQSGLGPLLEPYLVESPVGAST